MRRFITRKDNKIGFIYESLSFKNVVVRESTPVDEFYFERKLSSDDGKECVGFTDPIKMLFNQERLNSIGVDAALKWVESLKNFKQDPLADVRAKCSDEDLKCLIKSRHLQQPSEIMAYAEWCRNNIELFNAEVQKIAEARRLELTQQQQQSTEPPKSE